MVVKLDGSRTKGRAGIVCEEHDADRLRQAVRQEVAQPELTVLGPRLSCMVGTILEVEPVDGDEAGGPLGDVRVSTARRGGTYSISGTAGGCRQLLSWMTCSPGSNILGRRWQYGWDARTYGSNTCQRGFEAGGPST